MHTRRTLEESHKHIYIFSAEFNVIVRIEYPLKTHSVYNGPSALLGHRYTVAAERQLSLAIF